MLNNLANEINKGVKTYKIPKMKHKKDTQHNYWVEVGGAI